MIVLLSPSKTLSFEDAPSVEHPSSPVFLTDAERLMKKVKRLNANQLERLMNVNPKLAAQTAQWAGDWQTPFTTTNARPAALCFKGAVYTGLGARAWSEADFTFAQHHVRVLSGLYGVLKPLDLMQPYRLEMGLNWSITPTARNLYAFWGTKIQSQIASESGGLIINLASQEYSKAAIPRSFDGHIITPAFKDCDNGVYKAKMAYAKEARGTLARHIVQNRWKDPEEMKAFSGMGYAFNEALSTHHDWVFTRHTPATK